MSDLMSAGGSFSVVILGLAALGVLVTLALAGLAFSKRRVPLTLLVAVPLLTCAIGSAGAWMTAGTSLGTFDSVDPNTIVSTAQVGLYDALATDWFSRWVAAFLFGCGAWAAAVGAFFAGPEGRFTPVAAGAAALFSVLGAVVILAFSGWYGIGGGTILAVLILFSGMGVAFSALKRAMYEDAQRVAGMRFTAGMCMLLALSYGGRALTMGSRMDTFGPDGIAHKATDLMSAIALWTDIAAPVATLAWVAFAFGIAIALAGVYYELSDVVERFTLVDVALTLVMITMLGGVRTLSDWRIDRLASVSTNAPAAAMFAELGGELPASLLSVDKVSQSVFPLDGGFGDVLAYSGGEWHRRFAWNGGGWDPVDEPVTGLQLSPLRPLLVIGSGEDAAPLAKMVAQVGGKALLLLRAYEVKGDVEVPVELAYLQVTFLDLEISTSRDLKTELWATPESKEYNWGPTTWYGEGMDGEPIAYADAVFEATAAPGVQVIVGPKSRMKGLVSTCLPAVMEKTGEGKWAHSGKWCRMAEGDAEEVRTEAMGLWERPAPEGLIARWGKETPGVEAAIGRELVIDRLSRELGGVDYCLAQARDEGEAVAGPMQLWLTFTEKGALSTDLHEKSRNVNETAIKCVRDRFKNVKLAVNADAWPKPLPPEKEGEEPAPLPPETLELLLEIR